MKRNKTEDISEKLRIGFERARQKLIEHEKKTNGYIVVSDKEGNVIKIPAKDL
jgi:hypothetical protein